MQDFIRISRALIFLFMTLSLPSVNLYSQDTLRVMTYNVLHYGDGCQGSNSLLHSNLKTIVQYARPDVLGMVKAQVIKITSNDFAGISPVGFADSILNNAFNAAFANTFEHCPVVNFANDPDGDMDLLFYNKKKLGFLSVINLCTHQEDFNLYKLYYKDPALSNTKDTTFIYFILNHTVSGTSSSLRDHQDSLVIKNLKSRFTHLPNLISMGDFNTHSSLEPGYQLLTTATDSSFVFSDPPYWPDKKLTYPSDWQNDASAFASYLNTSTREGTLPNACGTSGGAKGWYLHSLVSAWLVNGKNYIRYVPGSYLTLGNDGKRVGFSINDSINVTKNTAVPGSVVNSLFQFSDKYPVMIKLAVASNTTGVSLPDPEKKVVTAITPDESDLFIENPINSKIMIHFPVEAIGQQGTVTCYNTLGQVVQQNIFFIDATELTLDANVEAGFYLVEVKTPSLKKTWRVIKK